MVFHFLATINTDIISIPVGVGGGGVAIEELTHRYMLCLITLVFPVVDNCFGFICFLCSCSVWPHGLL